MMEKRIKYARYRTPEKVLKGIHIDHLVET